MTFRFILSGCQSAVQTEGIADPTATIYKSVWYRHEDFMKGLELWQDQGALVLNDKDIQFVGKKYRIIIDEIQGISFGRLSKTIITDSSKWVKIDYAYPEGNPKKALFMDAKNLGYSGWLGGNKKMYETIKQKYEGSISK
jgi:hypothetical protein